MGAHGPGVPFKWGRCLELTTGWERAQSGRMKGFGRSGGGSGLAELPSAMLHSEFSREFPEIDCDVTPFRSSP